MFCNVLFVFLHVSWGRMDFSLELKICTLVDLALSLEDRMFFRMIKASCMGPPPTLTVLLVEVFIVFRLVFFLFILYLGNILNLR